jgi:hypothetical protein
MFSYVCVSMIGHTLTQPPTSTTSPPSNGIETPTPIQPGMIDNCDAFYFAEPGQGCASIAAANGISLTQFVNWDPRVNRDYYVLGYRIMGNFLLGFSAARSI